MEKGIETGKDKIKRICDALRKETLEPAQKDAAEVIERAEAQAKEIVAAARQSVEAMKKDAAVEIEKKRNAFEGALRASAQKAIQSLKANIEEKLLQPALMALIRTKMQEPDVIGQLIDAIVLALKKEGTNADMSLYISSSVSVDAINARVSAKIIEQLREKSVLVAPFGGGIAVKLHKEKMTIELTDEAMCELVTQYIQKEFRALFFANGE